MIKKWLKKSVALILSMMMLGTVSIPAEETKQDGILHEAMTETMGEDFIVGTAIVNSELTDSMLMNVVTKHFNAVTLGNELKPDAMFGYSPSCPGTETVELNGEELIVPKMNYDRAEKTLNAIKEWNDAHPEHIIKIRGHVLVWHSQTPEWFFHEDYDAKKPFVTKEEMDKRQEWYIKTMAEHFTAEDSPYHGMFYGWDVVNEAVSDSSGTYRKEHENSNWWAVYQSQEFIINAFRYANKYMDPSIDLFYNDYNEWYAQKRNGILQLLRDVKEAEGTRINGMGMQGHYQTEADPTISDFLTSARAYAEEVEQIQVTELDLKASSGYHGGSEGLEAEYSLQAKRYLDLYNAMQKLKEEGVNITGMTVWGVIDPNSWLQTFQSVGGGTDGKKTQVPLLFDGAYQPKPCFYAFVDPSIMTTAKKEIGISKVDQGGGLSGCLEYHMSCMDADVAIKPSWNAKGIGFKVSVSDKQKTEGDKVTLYLMKDGEEEILTAEKTREQGIFGGSGYDVVLFIPLEEADLQAGNSFLFELAVTNRGLTETFSGTEWNGEPESSAFSVCTLNE